MKLGIPWWVLVHSPLVGPSTWGPVADELRQRGYDVVVPRLEDTDGVDAPYWQQHAASAARVIETVPHDRPLVLVGHSGAGPLLPAIGRQIPRSVAAYIFVDAGLPHGGVSRLADMEANSPEFATTLSQDLTAGRPYPTWTNNQLRDDIPDAERRQQILTELRPRDLVFFREPLPVVSGWPNTACAYLQLSPVYDKPAAHARECGWPYRTVNAGHFHMLVDPVEVTTILLNLIEELRLPEIMTNGA